MSIPVRNEGASLERFGRVIRVTPVFVAIILAALWLSGERPLRPDFRLSAPVVARPGSTIGVRAWQLVRDDRGRLVVRAPNTVIELRNEVGLQLATVALSHSAVHGLEGSLAIPPSAEGKLAITALATIDGREVAVSRTLFVREGIESRRDAGRTVNAFQMYELGPLRIDDPSSAPKTIDPRVEEGSCVPELDCFLSVWVGGWEGRVRIGAVSGVEVRDEVMSAEGGFARFPLTIRGQEARVVVEALDRWDEVVALRAVRLPVVPGGLVARAGVEGTRVRLRWQSLGGPQPVLVDVFDRRRWIGAFSLSAEQASIGVLPAGIWRFQLRADLFSDNTGAVAYAVVGVPPGVETLRAAADAVLAEADRGGLDPLAMAVLEGSFSGDSAAATRALFAIPSFGVISTGRGVSSRIGVDDAAAQRQDLRRWQAAGIILVLGLIVSATLWWSARVAQARARRLVESLDTSEPPSTTSTPPGRALWALVLVVFVLLAALALSKRWF